MNREKIRKFFLRLNVYFRRGHNIYFALLVSFLNFIVIQYRLLIEHIPLLKQIFPRLFIFLLTFIAVYVPITIFVGWWDTKKGVFPEEARILWSRNPMVRELFRKIERIEKKLEEIEKKIRK